jgi:hypothetical protein
MVQETVLLEEAKERFQKVALAALNILSGGIRRLCRLHMNQD